MSSTCCYKINSPSVINETIEGESVIINLNSGIYYSLDNIGSIIWNALGEQHSVAAIAESIAFHYQLNPADVETTVDQLVKQLLEEQLILPLPENESVTVSKPLALPEDKQAVFGAPVLNKFKDMQDLLLLDPIHEVDEAGWPYTKPE